MAGGERMEPVTLILAALAAGASAGALDALKDGTKEKAKAAYARLRGLVERRVSGRPHGQLALAEYESAPQKWEGLLAAELTEVGAAHDDDLVAAAKALMELVDQTGARSGKYNVTIRDSKAFQVGDRNVLHYYHSEKVEWPTKASGKLVHFFTAGCGVGNRIALMPVELTVESKASLSEFANALTHIGATSADVRYITSLAETGILLPGPFEPGKTPPEVFLGFMNEVTDKIRPLATAEEYQWYTLGRLLYEVPTVLVLNSYGHKGLHSEREALAHLANTISVSSGLRANLIEFAQDSGNSFEHMLERANRLALTCYEILQ
jgi:hypothetical protein